MTTEANKPIRTFRVKGLRASVFENQGEQGIWHKVSLQKIYKEGTEFKSTTSFGRDDLPLAMLLLRRAWEFILEKESGEGKSEAQGTSHSWNESITDTTSESIARNVGMGQSEGTSQSVSKGRSRTKNNHNDSEQGSTSETQ